MGWTTGVACMTAVALTACAHDADGALPERPPPTSAPATDGNGDLYDDYVEAQAENLRVATLNSVSLDTARCIAGAVVDVTTVEALQEAEVTPDDLAQTPSLVALDVELAGGPSGAIDDLAVAFVPCDFGTDLEPPLVDSLGSVAGADLTESDAACVVDRLDDETFEAAVAETVVEGSESMVEAIIAAVGECPGALAEVVAGFITEGTGQDVAASALTCLEEQLADEPGASDVIWVGGPDATALLSQLAAACGLEFSPDSTTPTTTEEPDEPATPGEVGGGWDPDLGFGTDTSPPVPDPPPAGTPPDALEVVTLVEGSGPAAALGDELVVHYVGVLPDGRVLDSSWELGEPFTLPSLGDGSMIEGWEEGLVGAQVGERRRLVIGSDNAYGPEGNADVPPNTPLAFEIDVLEITPG